MKLVDLLVKELFRWPECVTYFVQDGNGDVKAGSGSKLREPLESRIWIRHTPLDSFNFYSGLCTDWQTSVVTKDIYTKHKEGMLLTQQTQMKQIIVNVGGLPIEEKQRVNEALAKIKNIMLCPPTFWGFPMDWEGVRIMFVTSYDGGKVGFDNCANRSPTHTVRQVLEMAGMAEQGHIHSELMRQYAEDAMTHSEPWKLWQIKDKDDDGVWFCCQRHPIWATYLEYRRKLNTYNVNGVEIPDLRIKPKNGQGYWYPDASIEALVCGGVHGYESSVDSHRLTNNLCYEPTEDGKQAAILHAKAWLGIA